MDSHSPLKIRVGGVPDGVPARAFHHALGNTLGILEEINKSASPFGSAGIQWLIVDSEMNSPLATEIMGADPLTHDAELGSFVMGIFVDGLASLSKSPVPPPLFSETALSEVSKLTSTFAEGVSLLEFSRGSRVVTATKVVSSNANRALRLLQLERSSSEHLKDYGSIEGTLVSVTAQKSADSVLIEDSLTHERVKCRVPVRLEQQVFESWRKRVELSGVIEVDRVTAQPRIVHVDDIRVIPSPESLPQIDDLLDIDITGGILPEDYIQELRDAE